MIKDILRGIDLLYLAQEKPAQKGCAWTAFLKPADIVEAARRLLAAEYHLEDITGLDAREGFLVMYAFDREMKPGRLSLRVLLPHDKPYVPSIYPVYQGAEWHERETTDFYGIHFEGNPNPTRLLLPPDMNDRPLRKKDAERAPLRAIFAVAPGECLHKDPAFTLLDEEPAPAPADGKAAEPAASKEG